MKKYFITGTDTNVGKTLAAAVLTLASQGCYWKPIQSGIAAEQSDPERVQFLSGLNEQHCFPPRYSFKASLSPDQAAALENITINLEQCVIPQTSRPLFIEGAGGVLVPLNDKARVIDMMKKFQLPIIIVTRGSLGTINHTLLTIEILRQNGLNINGIIISGKLHLPNQMAIEKWGKVQTLFHIPHFDDVQPTVLQNWVKANRQLITEKLL